MELRRPALVTAATFEPVSLAEAKKQVELPLAYGAHDNHLSALIQAARETVEHDTGMVLCSSTWQWKLDHFPDDDELEFVQRPISAISSITYVDSAGTTQTWSSDYYLLDQYAEVPSVQLKYLAQWPTVRGGPQDVTINYTAGYASQDAIPRLLRQAVLLLVAHWFEQRTPVITGSISSDIPETYQALVNRYMRCTYP